MNRRHNGQRLGVSQECARHLAQGARDPLLLGTLRDRLTPPRGEGKRDAIQEIEEPQARRHPKRWAAGLRLSESEPVAGGFLRRVVAGRA